MDRSKDTAAEYLAQAHYAVEPGIRLIVRLESSPDAESSSKEPIKLLEVNENTTTDGIRPVFFGAHPASGVPYPSVIVEVTPGEYEEIRRRPSLLPNGWRLGREVGRAPAARAV